MRWVGGGGTMIIVSISKLVGVLLQCWPAGRYMGRMSHGIDCPSVCYSRTHAWLADRCDSAMLRWTWYVQYIVLADRYLTWRAAHLARTDGRTAGRGQYRPSSVSRPSYWLVCPITCRVVAYTYCSWFHTSPTHSPPWLIHPCLLIHATNDVKLHRLFHATSFISINLFTYLLSTIRYNSKEEINLG